MYIQNGGVKLSVVNEVGKEAVVAILGPRDFFGEGCLAGQDSGRCSMKFRIAAWTIAGFLVASGWAVYFLLASKDRPIEPIVSTLARLTCPVAIVGSHYPMSLYSVIGANIATYALVGLAVEIVRRQSNHSN